MAGLGRDPVALKRAREDTLKVEANDIQLNTQRKSGRTEMPVEMDIPKAVLGNVVGGKPIVKPRMSDYMK